jgi:hypothetical protein
MVFTLQIFLYAYYAFLAVWGIFFLIALYHMFKYGFKNITTVFAIIFFAGIAFIILNVSFGLIGGIDWGQEIRMDNVFGGNAQTEIY